MCGKMYINIRALVCMNEQWIKTFRSALKTKVGKGWNVINSRGYIRLQVGRKPNVISLTTHYKWTEDDWLDALNRIVLVHKEFEEAKGKLDLKSCYAIIGSASNLAENNWIEALDKYRLFKTRVNEKTWRTKHHPVIVEALKALQKKKPPKNGEQLCELSLAKWKKGTQQRRHMRLAIFSFLNYVVNRQDFPSYWLPPAFSDDEVVVKTKRIGYPLSDSQIIRLIDSIKNPKWRFAIQLMTTYGLRPNDIKNLHTRNAGRELWSNYRKSQGGKKGQTTEPRQLFPLFIQDIDGTPINWNLMQRIHIREELPPLNDLGGVGQAVGRFLRDNQIWKELKQEAINEKQQLTPYSFRHRFAYVGHNRKKPDGTYRAPKQIADAMGHTLDVHLKSYARFMTKELAQNFDKELVEA